MNAPPSVCVHAAIGTLAVWIQNKKKKTRKKKYKKKKKKNKKMN